MTRPIAGIEKAVDGLGKKTAAVTSSIGRVASGAGKVFATVGKIAVGVGASAMAAGTAVFGLATKASKAADDIAETAASLGMSTKALQEYRYVAQLTGLTTEEMDSALSKLTVNLGKGGSEVESALASIGLSVGQLKAAGPDQALEAVANALQGVQDPAQRAAVVTTLFGRSSIKMINALSGGEAALRSLRQEAGQVGYVMDEAAIAAGTTMGDALDRLQATAAGLFNRIGSTFFPIVTQAVDGIGKFILQNEDLFGRAVASLGKVFEAIGPFAEKLLQAFAPLLEQIGPILSGAIDKLVPVFARLLEAAGPVLEKIIASIDRMLPSILKVAEAVGKVLIPVFELLSPVLDLILPVIELLARGIAEVVGWIADGLGPIVEWITGVVEKVSGFFGGKNKAPALAMAGAPALAAPALPAAGRASAVPLSSRSTTIESNSTTTTQRGIVDVNFNGAPAGTTVKTSGAAAPAVTLSTGSARRDSRNR